MQHSAGMHPVLHPQLLGTHVGMTALHAPKAGMHALLTLPVMQACSAGRQRRCNADSAASSMHADLEVLTVSAGMRAVLIIS